VVVPDGVGDRSFAQFTLRNNEIFATFTLSKKSRSFAEFTLSGTTRFFAAVRMTSEALRMTGEGLRMTSEGLRMTDSCPR
jgi:hypothetical protein